MEAGLGHWRGGREQGRGPGNPDIVSREWGGFREEMGRKVFSCRDGAISAAENAFGSEPYGQSSASAGLAAEETGPAPEAQTFSLRPFPFARSCAILGQSLLFSP